MPSKNGHKLNDAQLYDYLMSDDSGIPFIDPNTEGRMAMAKHKLALQEALGHNPFAANEVQKRLEESGIMGTERERRDKRNREVAEGRERGYLWG